MGCAGLPLDRPEHHYSIATGVNRGNGYQGYTAIGYFLKQDYVSQDAKDNLIKHLKSLGYYKD